jgi:hypothetical protein
MGATTFEDDRGSDGSTWEGVRRHGCELFVVLGLEAWFDPKSGRAPPFYRGFSPYNL